MDGLGIGDPKHVTATGDVVAQGNPRIVGGVLLTAGSDAATLTLKTGGSSGATLLVIKAAANTSRSVFLGGMQFHDGIHATLAGTDPVATVNLV